ncbi:MAG: murein L,D-transpeptidase catalytic domain family protein [Bdellovibrionaceae bacterium]|nr:murein L,D-transpeptidase catalytic domain family protein [Bdellovibrionales bacterium]MCB9084890.1 murein L,D-transpeptidase catalytic domain family protein [Pseudobdellovibrionaceae bacterium]
MDKGKYLLFGILLLNQVQPCFGQVPTPSVPRVSWSASSMDSLVERCVADKTRISQLPVKALKFDEGKLLSKALRRGLPELAVRRALQFLQQNQDRIPNKEYLTIVDYAQSALDKRFHILRLRDGETWSFPVQHGRESDPDQDGFVNSLHHFGNEVGTHMSIVGFAVTGGSYYGHSGTGLIIHGMETAKNDQACRRSIVVKGGDKVGTVWRSRGSVVLDSRRAEKVIGQIKDGSVIYFYPGQ